MQRSSLRKHLCLFLAGLLLLCCLPANAAAGLHGDADFSGGLSSADARLILRMAVKLEEITARRLYAGDCNADGEITAADARLALRASVGLETLSAHIYRQNEAGAFVCVVCGHVEQQTTAAEPASSAEETTAREPHTAAAEETTAPVQEPETSVPAPVTEQPAVTVNGTTLSLQEPFGQIEADLGQAAYTGHTVRGLTTAAWRLKDGGVLLAFFHGANTLQAFYVLSSDVSQDGLFAGDGDALPEARSAFSLYYDLSPFAGAAADVPDRCCFRDPYADNAVYAVFCRAPGVSFVPDTDSKRFSADAERELTLLINAFRAVNGNPALKTSTALCTAARTHSAEMAEKNYYSLDSADGTPYYRRIENSGAAFTSCRENITAACLFSWEALNDWVASAEQRGNLLNGLYARLGAGVAFNAKSDYQCYWTVDLTD